MRHRPLTPEQQAKTEARRARFKTLAQQIGALSPDQRAALAARSGVVTIEGHALSIHNACLIACQAPDATIVGGFQQWRRAGRQVRKGESGLMIWAPKPQKEDPNRQPGEISSADLRPGFLMVTVFDVAQTDAVGAEVSA